MILIEPGLITTEFGEAAASAVAGVSSAVDEGPYASFNAAVGALTKGAYEGPMRQLGGGPDRVAAVIEQRDRRAAGARCERPSRPRRR